MINACDHADVDPLVPSDKEAVLRIAWLIDKPGAGRCPHLRQDDFGE
ncbi:hypothetical protein [Streptomyces sp. NPDC091212]